jgi:phage terminase large subunit-like protein
MPTWSRTNPQDTEKIDPPMAAFNAIALMSTNPWSTRPGLFII